MSANIGNNRKRPPEAWMMRTSRWAWLTSSEDGSNRPLGLSSPFFIGNTANTPDPLGGLLGWPVLRQ